MDCSSWRRLKAIFVLILYLSDVCTDVYVGLDLALRCHYKYAMAVLTIVALPGVLFQLFMIYVSIKDRKVPHETSERLLLFFGAFFMVPVTAWRLIKDVVIMDRNSLAIAKL